MSNEMTRKEIEEQMITRAWQDETFKQELLTNPKAAFEKEGISLPQEIEVKVVEENSNSFYLVLPIKPNETAELSESDLEAVAGGGNSLINVWKCE